MNSRNFIGVDMNPNTEYEKFAQEIYQGLLNEESIKAIQVQHNVKLRGKSGQLHQVDVYWEYELAGVNHKVAIECKNYNKPVSVGKVRDFYGVLSDLNNVNGIMVTKVGYQKGAKEFAAHYGINLKELRLPNKEESIIGRLELNLNISITRRLFLLDDEWGKSNINLEGYRKYLMFFSEDNDWTTTNYFPLETLSDAKICDKNGIPIMSFDELEDKLPSENTEPEYIFNFEDAYVDTRNMGRVKIKKVKYVFIQEREKKVFDIDARYFIKAILKDVLNGEIKVIAPGLKSTK